MTILGGCGHVGLPLGLALADSGLQVTLYDNNMAAVDQVQAGKMPHLESGAQEVLLRTLADGNLTASVEASTVGAQRVSHRRHRNAGGRALESRPASRDHRA